jgi:hypothetical protein
MHAYFRKKLPDLLRAELDARIEETLKFLVISRYCTGPIPVTKDIDDVWHYWILETKEYVTLCGALETGEFIHHTSNQYLEYFQDERQESEDLLLGVRMLATYVENFGSFEQDRTRYWLLADFLCNKRGWSVQDLNEWLTSCPSEPRASADIYHVPIHEIPVQAASCLILAS